MNCRIYNVSIFLRILYIPFSLVTEREHSGPLVRSILSPFILAGPISPLSSATQFTPLPCAGCRGTAPAYSNQAHHQPEEGEEAHASPSSSLRVQHDGRAPDFQSGGPGSIPGTRIRGVLLG